MAKKYKVTLTDEERLYLHTLTTTGTAAARKLNHARILLLADASNQGQRTDAQIVDALGVGLRTVERVRQRFVEEGFEAALVPKPQPRRLSKVEALETEVVDLAKSDPPTGRKRWTLRLLAEQVVHLGYAEDISHESIRQLLKKTA